MTAPVFRSAKAALSLSRRKLLAAGGALALGVAPWRRAAGQNAPPPGAGGGGRAQNMFRIATGTTGGTYYPIGTIIANALSNPPGTRPCDKGGSCGVPGLIAVAQATSGSVENLNLLASGAVEAAMTQADTAWLAYTGAGPFVIKGPFESLRTLGTLYVETIHVVARADFRRIQDLRGLRVSLGEEGSGTLADARLTLLAHGLREADVKAAYLKPATAADRLLNGELDAYFMVGGYPVQSIVDLAARGSIRLLPIEGAPRRAMLENHRFLVEAAIPAEVYHGVDAVQTIGVGAELAVRADRDPEFIYKIVQALWHERTRALLTEGHPRGASIVAANAVAGVATPLHPGAERYYREVGLLGDPPAP